MMKNTNHYCCSQSYQSREHLISKFSNEVMANRRILTKLVLKPLRVSLKMLEDFVIRCYKYESHLEHQLLKMYFTITLMWSFHEQYAICQKFDQLMLFQRALLSSIRVDQGLLLSTLYMLSSLLKTTYTFDNYFS